MSKDIEVIAKKYGDADSINFFFTILGIMGIGVDIFLWIILGVNGIFSFKELGGTFLLIALLLVILLVGIVFLRVGLKNLIANSNLPNELIKYQDGELVFADGYRCKPSDIVDLDCFKVERDGTPQMKALNANPYGWLNVTTKDKTIKYPQVEKVRDAYEKLMYYKQSSIL